MTPVSFPLGVGLLTQPAARNPRGGKSWGPRKASGALRALRALGGRARTEPAAMRARGGPHGLCTHATTPRRQKNAIFALKIRVMLKKHAKFSAQVFKTQAVFLQGLMSLQDPRTRGDASKNCIPSSSVHTPSKPRPYSCKV